jgi:aspartyl aminopeptidase
MAAEDPSTEELNNAKDFVDYLNTSQSAFHCVSEVSRRLSAAGFVELDERRSWNESLLPNGKYYVTRNGSSLIAFAVGGAYDSKTSGMMIIGAHTDSPCPKLKPVSNLEKDGHVMLGVVGYGGGIWHSWFDRDLTVAGRALVRNAQGGLESRLVHVPKALCRIPTLAIHLSQGDERTTFKPNLQNHFPPLMATKITDALWREKRGNNESKEDGCMSRHPMLLIDAVAKSLNVNCEDIVDFELQLADTQPSALLGCYDEFISSGRLDNQGSCYMVTRALVDSISNGSLATDSSIRMISMFDHEEVGSLSAQGAQSTFFNDVIARTAAGLKTDPYSLRARSFQISSDMAHAVHPNYSDRHDPNNNVRLGCGLVIKHNANQRYATNSIGASLMRKFSELSNAPIQEFAVKADSACGTTIGPITASGSGIRTVDVGPPQLSMHSCREMMAAKDVTHSINIFVTAYQHFATLSQSIVEGPTTDPFWGKPGNGWGLKTA